MIELKLKKIMRSKNLTIQDIFEKTNISRNTISQMINKEPKGIQFDTLEKLIKAYNLKITDLLEYVDETPSDIQIETDGPLGELSFTEDVCGDEENNISYISSIDATLPFKLHVKNADLNVIIPSVMKISLSISVVDYISESKSLDQVTVAFVGNQFSNSIYRLFTQSIVTEIEQILIDFVAEQIGVYWNEDFNADEANYEITNF